MCRRQIPLGAGRKRSAMATTKATTVASSVSNTPHCGHRCCHWCRPSSRTTTSYRSALLDGRNASTTNAVEFHVLLVRNTSLHLPIELINEATLAFDDLPLLVQRSLLGLDDLEHLAHLLL